MRQRISLIFSALTLVIVSVSGAISAESICYGTTSKGKLENGCQLPSEGENFTAYSYIGAALGRTYVHCKVAEVVLSAYEKMKVSHPDRVFVYGETGWPTGGSFKPHKTHQNGLSADFMVPVVEKSGKSVPLSTSVFNKYGYNVEFNAQGKHGEQVIDFEAMAAHILAIKHAAAEKEVTIRRVIFDPKLQPLLHSTKAWPALKGQVEFSERRSWVRHDEHYHIDFDVPCKPLF